MKQSTKRLLSSLLAVVFVAAAFMIFFNFIRPAYEDAERVRGEQLSRQNFVDNQKAVIEQVKKLVSMYKGEEKIQELASFALPLGTEVAGALNQLTGLTSNNNLAAQSFSTAVPSLQNVPGLSLGEGGGAAVGSTVRPLIKPVGLLNVQVRFSGSYEDFRTFLRQLETNIRIFDLKTLNFQQSGKTNQSLYTFDMTVATYYQSK